MAFKYEMTIYWSNADDCFLVEVSELPGCMADGKTYEEAVANAQRVLAEWTETARSLGRPVPAAGSLVARESPSHYGGSRHS
jgi:predicted RNase H-like HicB family nuclease